MTFLHELCQFAIPTLQNHQNSHIFGAAYFALSFRCHGSAAIAANVSRASVADVHVNGEKGIDGEEDVFQEAEVRDEVENEIDEEADDYQRHEIREIVVPVGGVAQVVDGGDEEYEYEPQAADENGSGQRESQGIELGVEVEFAPHVHIIALHVAVNDGADGDGEAQQHGIDGMHVVEMHEMHVLLAQKPDDNEHGADAQSRDEAQHAIVGKVMEQMRNNVIGQDFVSQDFLGHPSLPVVFIDNFHRQAVFFDDEQRGALIDGDAVDGPCVVGHDGRGADDGETVSGLKFVAHVEERQNVEEGNEQDFYHLSVL